MEVNYGRTIEIQTEKLTMNQGTRELLRTHKCNRSPSAFSKPNNKQFLVLYLPP